MEPPPETNTASLTDLWAQRAGVEEELTAFASKRCEGLCCVAFCRPATFATPGRSSAALGFGADRRSASEAGGALPLCRPDSIPIASSRSFSRLWRRAGCTFQMSGWRHLDAKETKPAAVSHPLPEHLRCSFTPRRNYEGVFLTVIMSDRPTYILIQGGCTQTNSSR